MLSDDIILLRDNTQTARKTQELLQKFGWGVCSHPSYTQIWHPIWVPNPYLEQASLQTAAENWLSRQGRHFYQAELNKLVLRSDKFLNGFGDYVEK
ncbi:hypothetical protein AVEN_230056-1 [Araneus ventricosus]|uniref:Uncharacterized protein n=1 Tax=Araneus ventricosus TaxID=182803 RepID=A0A4Y2CWH8_ARAVE|nr:hypothetical protein AVEN_230056-1 [Araneus ventricosus]